MKNFVLALALLMPSMVLHAQNPDAQKVVQALKTGNTKELAAQCIPNIDLTVLGTDDVYSRAQAEQILKKFFTDHPPRDFTIEHNGVSKMGDHYVIGKLTTADGEFRVTFFQKKFEENYKVKQLRIEEGRSQGR